MRVRALLGSAIAAGLVLAGCTTLPDSSAPQVVKPVEVQPAGGAPVGPPPGADARSIVEDFLNENAVDEPNHASARLYLTNEEKNRWSDSTVIVVDRTQVSNIVMDRQQLLPAGQNTGTITVTGQQIGTVDESGAYKPSLRGNGTGLGGIKLSQTYRMVQVRGEWRIDSLPNGLFVTTAQFAAFRQFAVYFFDGTEEHLVPEPRYTQLTGAADTVAWLMDQLAQGANFSQLQTGLPGQNGAKQVRTTFPSDPSDPSTPVKVEIPGSSALDAGNLNRLGAQVAATLEQVLQVDRIQITDGGAPVRIPAAGGDTFTGEQLSGRFEPSTPANQVFYVYEGAVFSGSGRRVPGKVGAGVYGLTSVAVSERGASDALQFAGVRGRGAQEVLDISDNAVRGQMVATTVHGVLSRPAWAPGRSEVWIGAGTELERVTGVRSAQSVPLDGPGGKASGQVTAVRLSPDGTRVALVLTTPTGSQIYVGYIVRSADGVRVDNLVPISPQGVAVTDVAWNDQLKLFAVGRDLSTDEDGVFEVQCDGSLWTPRGNAGLPGRPDSVTAAAFSEAVVSSGGTVLQQQGATWEGLLGAPTLGTNPVYLE
jgi:hypothetical protein